MTDTLDKLKKECLQRKQELRFLQEEKTKKIISKYGDFTNFINKLNVELIESPNNPRLREIYDFYTTFFPLEDERESFEGFQTALSLNFNSKLQKKLSSFKECWFLAYCSEGELIAGINFSMYTFPKNIALEHNTNGSGNIIYIFVKEKFRMLGTASYLLSKAEDYIKQYTNSLGYNKDANIDPLITCEMNAPELMETEDYFTDTFFAGIDPCDRLLWWHKKNYKRLCFNYAQPPLTADGTHCTSLTLNLKSSIETNDIQGVLVHEHLKRYFQTSVFKGIYPKNDLYLKELEKFLLNNKVNIIHDGSYYNSLKLKHHSQEKHIPMKSLFESPKMLFNIPLKSRKKAYISNVV